MKKWMGLFLLTAAVLMAGEVSVSVEKVQQRWPWNGKVDIDYTVTYDDANADVYVGFIGKDGGENRSFPLKTLEGDGANGVVKAGKHRVTWDMSVDEPNLHTGDFTVTIQAFTGAYPYMVVDLSGGVDVARYPVRYSATPPDVTKDECRTTELWLRLIFPGTSMMGSPAEELGHHSYDAPLHKVTLTKPFYIGVFEVTQKQYQLVMGTNPSYYKGDTRPVEHVSYNMLRGTVNGASWPVSNQVDEDSFFYVLRAKTSLLFDLPTEAQWEYACRAGTSTALNSGKNLTGTQSCSNMAELGRYGFNNKDGKGGYSQHTKVGSYLPNAWGLYDMHGNVLEWCLDWYGSLSSNDLMDPKGANSGSDRIFRGGAWASYCYAQNCRSAFRCDNMRFRSNGEQDYLGFRLVCLPVVQ